MKAFAAGIMFVFGIALVLQPERWANTPSYKILLSILEAQSWGFIYLAAAILLAISVAISKKTFSLFAHICAAGLMAVWWGAFIIRYLTDEGTTIVNVVSWSTYLVIILGSMLNDQGIKPLSFTLRG